MSIESRWAIPTFWLLSDNDVVPAETQRHFAGVIRRSFVPDRMMAQLERTLLADSSPLGRLSQHLSSHARSWMVTATRQTLGVMSGHDVSVVSADGATIVDGVCGRITLNAPSVRLHVLIACNRGEADRLAGKVLRRPATVDTGTLDVFGELSNTIGGRARAALLERNFDLHISLPVVEHPFTLERSPAPFDFAEWFCTTSNDRFFVALRAEGVNAGEGGEGGVEELLMPLAALQGASVADGGDIDDVLF
jgi:CheY-specific phosphatase CheX